MKGFLYAVLMIVGVIIASLGAALILISFGNNGVSNYNLEVFIQKTDREVFAYLIDFAKMPLWNDDLTDVLTTNSKIVKVYGKGQNQYAADVKVIKVVPYKYFEYQETSQYDQISHVYTLEGIQNSTKLKYTSSVQFKTTPDLFFALSRFNLQKKMEARLNKLKTLIEAQ